MKRYRTSTDEFVAQFKGPSDFVGEIAEMVGGGIMPRSVDRADERVKAIVDRCRKNTRKERTS